MVTRLNLLLASIILLNFPLPQISVAQPEEPTLPVYSLIIDPAHIEYLDINWWTSKKFPAVIVIDGDSLSCCVRYRGASARRLKKKSWKVYLDEAGPGGVEELNLNSEYRDRSISRNHFCMELSRFAEIPTPQTRHISLFVNNIYAGVFLEVENTDEQFLRRNNLCVGALWKAVNHGARCAPFVQREHLYLNHEPKIKPLGAVDTLLCRFAWLIYADQDAVKEGLKELIDIEEVLTYFAVQYIVNNGDGYTKNYFIYEGNDGRWLIFPWDCDATLGNSWQGDWVDEVNNISDGFLKYNALFQRLISIPMYRSRFLEIIDYLIKYGLEHVADCVEETFDEIRHDVYMDTARKGNNEDFELERTRLLEWLTNRTESLDDLDWFNWLGTSSMSVYPEYIQRPSDTFQISADLTENAYRVFAYIFDSSGANHKLELLDDGSHGDREAGDLTYTANITLKDAPLPFHFSVYCTPNANEGYPTPPSGWLYFNSFPSPLPVIRLEEGSPEANDLVFTTFHRNKVTETQYFCLRNAAGRSVDISGCIVRIGSDHRKWQIKEMPALTSDNTLVITNHYDEIRAIFDDSPVTGDFCFPIAEGDTLRLETWGGRLITSTVVEGIDDYRESVENIVINEINYNSADDFDAGDWIELYCRGGNYDLSNWILKDECEDHEFEIPNGTRVSGGEYLVIAENLSLFRSKFPDVNRVIGGSYFAFGGNCDEVRLFDDNGLLIDHVRYEDNDPWPEEADGNGPTLELVNFSEVNYGPEHWQASSDDFPHGSPGKQNSRYPTIEDPDLFPTAICINSIYPNPSNGQLFVSWSQPCNGNPSITIYDVLGRKIVNLNEDKYSTGNHTLTWNTGKIPAGVYLLRFELHGHLETKKVALVK